jgi:hypothetical protein
MVDREQGQGQMTRDIVIAYASNDESLANKIQHLLAPLEKKNLIRVQKDKIRTKDQRVSKGFNLAEIILLLVGPEFLDSDYCYCGEMRWAVARHIEGKTYLLPIILRAASWQRTPFFELQALPRRSEPEVVTTIKDILLANALEVAENKQAWALEDAAYAQGKAQTGEASPMEMIREVNAAWDAASVQTRGNITAKLWKQRYLEGRLGIDAGKLPEHQMYALFGWSC